MISYLYAIRRHPVFYEDSSDLPNLVSLRHPVPSGLEIQVFYYVRPRVFVMAPSDSLVESQIRHEPPHVAEPYVGVGFAA